MKLAPNGLKEADHARNFWLVTADPGVTVADLETPTFWAHVAIRLRARDRVEVHAADGRWMIEMIVRSATRLGASLTVLHAHEFAPARPAAALADADDIEIRWRGGAKWSAIRKSDKAILTEGHETREEAELALARPQRQAA